MNRIILMSITFLIIFGNVMAQTIDYNRIIIPEAAAEMGLEERLVQIAWQNNPTNRIVEMEVTAAEYDHQAAKAGYLDVFSIMGNLNEFNLSPQESTRQMAAFWPRYNVSAVINVGQIARTSANVKQTRELTKIKQEEIGVRKLELRAEVLTLYENYKMHMEVARLQRQIENDVYSSFLVVEDNFRNGEITLEEYNTFQKENNMERMRTITTENAYWTAKYELEKVLGVPLEDISEIERLSRNR
ncbi:MAG: TolC family protein [Cyclobacteriaceae bacterium]|nr:TolC family protein [Cyclobacteriaceae bacterium]